MGYHLPFGLLFFVLLLSHLTFAANILPLFKDDAAGQFYTSLTLGTPPVSVNLAIDFTNKISWFACDTAGYTRSSTYTAVPCGAPLCPRGSPCSSCNNLPSPSCNNNTCAIDAYSPLTSGITISDLIHDTLTSPFHLPSFPFTCTPTSNLKLLSRHTKGLLTLSRSPLSLSSTKFSLCPPSNRTTKGAISIGGGFGFALPSPLLTTALLINPHSTAPDFMVGESSIEYFIKVRTIKIDGSPVKINSTLLSKFDTNGNGGTKINPLEAYTRMKSEIYKPFVDLFVVKAAAMKVVRVPSIAPFGACFRAGKGMPIVDLVFNEKSAVLRGKNVRWRMYGWNSMVRVSEKVECLGFVDGGEDAVTSIVIGGKQLEDNVVEFDLGGKKLGFSSLLRRMGTSCDQLVKKRASMM